MPKKRRIMAGVMTAWALVALVGCAGPAFAGEGLVDITYTGEKSDFLITGSDLYAYVENGLPGDVFAGNLTIRNATEEPCEAFAAARDVVASGPDDILHRIPLSLETGDRVVYEAVLAEADGARPVSLGIIQPGETLNMDCTAVVPSELTNEYADAAVGMNMAVTVESRKPGASNDLVQTGGGTGTGTGLVQAGDMLQAVPFVLGALAAAGAVIWCAWKRRMRMW